MPLSFYIVILAAQVHIFPDTHPEIRYSIYIPNLVLLSQSEQLYDLSSPLLGPSALQTFNLKTVKPKHPVLNFKAQ